MEHGPEGKIPGPGLVRELAELGAFVSGMKKHSGTLHAIVLCRKGLFPHHPFGPFRHVQAVALSGLRPISTACRFI